MSAACAHKAEPVTLLDGTLVGYVCAHCLARLRKIRAAGSLTASATWQPCTDDGRPLRDQP